jgi:hypothetical protein
MEDVQKHFLNWKNENDKTDKGSSDMYAGIRGGYRVKGDLLDSKEELGESGSMEYPFVCKNIYIG